MNAADLSEQFCSDSARSARVQYFFGDDRPFRTHACQFFGRIPAHEAETVRGDTPRRLGRNAPQIFFFAQDLTVEQPCGRAQINQSYPIWEDEEFSNQ